MNRDGSDLRQLTFEKNVTELLSFSPDGQEVTFSANKTDNWDIWILLS